jgi:hypothetical protein
MVRVLDVEFLRFSVEGLPIVHPDHERWTLVASCFSLGVIVLATRDSCVGSTLVHRSRVLVTLPVTIQTTRQYYRRLLDSGGWHCSGM